MAILLVRSGAQADGVVLHASYPCRPGTSSCKAPTLSPRGTPYPHNLQEMMLETRGRSNHGPRTTSQGTLLPGLAARACTPIRPNGEIAAVHKTRCEAGDLGVIPGHGASTRACWITATNLRFNRLLGDACEQSSLLGLVGLSIRKRGQFMAGCLGRCICPEQTARPSVSPRLFPLGAAAGPCPAISSFGELLSLPEQRSAMWKSQRLPGFTLGLSVRDPVGTLPLQWWKGSIR